MPFTIPNQPDATFAAQAEVDSRDFDILTAGINRTGVVTGCAVTSSGSGNASVNVAAGVIRIANIIGQAGAGALQITANSSGNPRFDLITVDSSGADGVVIGTPGLAPVFPTIPADRCVLAAVYVPNGHTLSTTIPANTIVDKRVILGSSRSIYHDVRDYGAVGTNATGSGGALDCTLGFELAAAAANLCLAEAQKTEANGTGVVYVPGNADYKVTSTIDWPQNVQLIGGTGSGTGTAAPPTIRWHGTALGTMFQHVTDLTNIIGIWFQCVRLDGRSDHAPTGAGYLLGAGYLVYFGPLTTGNAKPDTGMQFLDCWLQGAGLDAIHFDGNGMTNWVFRGGRFDQITGYAVYVKITSGCFLTIKDMTYDNWGSNNPNESRGFIFLDGESNTGKSYLGLENVHLEVNGGYQQTYLPTGWTPTGCDTRGLIRLGINPSAPSVVQHNIHYFNMWVPQNPATNPFSIFQCTSSDLAGDHRARHAAAVRISGLGFSGLHNGTSPFGEGTAGATKMVGGVNAADNYPFNPAAGGVRQPNFFSFHPINAISVPSNEQSVDYFGGRFLATRLNLPQQSTVGAAGGGSALPATPVKYLKVYDDANNAYVVPAYNA